MSLIRIITGSESFANGSAQISVTLHETTRFPMRGVRSPYVNECAKNGNHVSNGQRAAYLPASNNGVREQGNYWDATYNVPDGLVLRVHAKRRQRSSSSRVEEQSGVLFLQARDEGPLQRLQLNRIDHHQSTMAPVIIEGRFDIIGLRTVASLGGAVSPQDLTLMRPERVAAVLTKIEVAPARRAAAKVKIETVRGNDGEEQRVVTTRTKRATNLG